MDTGRARPCRKRCRAKHAGESPALHPMVYFHDMRCLLASLTMLSPIFAQSQPARDILRELIEIDTTHSTGDTTRAAEAMAARLTHAGFAAADITVLGPHPRKGNLVA